MSRDRDAILRDLRRSHAAIAAFAGYLADQENDPARAVCISAILEAAVQIEDGLDALEAGDGDGADGGTRTHTA